MDCEKFEPLLLDELYEELDELTSAAVKRHVSGCARCASILGDMTATRRAVSLPLVPAPEGLEDRILAAAKEAQKVVPIKSRMSRALSIAGSWAMRPQTAMAAVFLLMIGTSAFLIRSKNYASRDAAVSVTVAGAPAPLEEVASERESLDDKAAATAHGPTPSNFARPPAPMPSTLAFAEADDNNGPLDRLTGGAARDKSKKEATSDPFASAFGGDTKGFAAPPATATASPTMPAAAAARAEVANASVPAGAPGAAYDGLSQTPPPPPAAKPAGGPAGGKDAQDPFSLGAAAFRARNFAEATRQFDVAAQSGDSNAALWAAESTREGQGCAVALGRFDQLAHRAAGSWAGNESSLRAARCQIAMGQLEAARARLDSLAHVPSHQHAAQTALDELNQVAARKAGGAGAAGGAVAAPKRAASPAARPASPARAPAEAREQEQQQKKALDHANGY